MGSGKILAGSLAISGILLATIALWVGRANRAAVPRVSYRQSANLDPSRIVSKDLGTVELAPTLSAAPELPDVLELRTNQVFRITGRFADPQAWKSGGYYVSIEFYEHRQLLGDVILNMGGGLLTYDENDPSRVTFECNSRAPRDAGSCQLRVRCGDHKYLLRGKVIVRD